MRAIPVCCVIGNAERCVLLLVAQGADVPDDDVDVFGKVDMAGERIEEEGIVVEAGRVAEVPKGALLG